MSATVAWIVPTGITLGGLVVTVLTYRIVRRNQVLWTARRESRPGSMTRPDQYVIIEHPTGPPAKDVRVRLEPVEDVHPMSGPGAHGEPETVPRLDRGGRIEILYGTEYLNFPNRVVVSWAGWFGRPRTWQSAL